MNYYICTEHPSLNSIKKLITEPGQIFKNHKGLKNSLKKSNDKLHSRMISYDNLNFIKLTVEEFANSKREKRKTIDVARIDHLSLVRNRGGLKSDSLIYEINRNLRDGKGISLDSKIENAFNEDFFEDDKINNVSIISMEFSENEFDEQKPAIRKNSDDFYLVGVQQKFFPFLFTYYFFIRIKIIICQNLKENH